MAAVLLCCLIAARVAAVDLVVVVVYNTQLCRATLPYATHSTVRPRGPASEGHLKRAKSGRGEICVSIWWQNLILILTKAKEQGGEG